MADLSLEIRHLDVSGGDSTAILVKNLATDTTVYAMLIDAGAEAHGSAYLKKYLEAHKLGPFDCIVATHYHQDHIQGFKAANIEFTRFLDNGGYPDKDSQVFKPRNFIGKGAQTTVFDSYKDRVQKQKTTRVEIPFIKDGFSGKAEPLTLRLGEHTGITLTCYCANGILANGKDILGEQKKTKNKDISPNDVSLAFVLEWGDFRYLTAGDLSGDRDISSYYNIEEHLVNYLTDLTNGPLRNKSITVFKASHHGSEHSNHADLLKTLKPDTIIVCCNIQKQVPSPLFLGRLGTYFTTQKTATAVFTNTMKIFKNDDRYAPLERIQDNIATGNVVFTGKEEKEEKDKQEQVASNLGIKCAIIRRRVRDGHQCDYDDMTLEGMQITKKTGYEIVLMPRDKDEANNLEATVKFRSYDLKRSWQSILADGSTIADCFKEQAKEMVRWLTCDRKETTIDEEATQGKDYITEHYPGLMKTIDEFGELGEVLELNLHRKMTEMFNSSFEFNKTQYPWMYKPKLSNLLTSDEKKTLYNLLMNNYHQKVFNKAIKYFNHPNTKKQTFEKTFAWNYEWAPEPYPTASGGKMRSEKKKPEARGKNKGES